MARCSIVAQLHLAPFASGVGGSTVVGFFKSENDTVMEDKKATTRSWISFRVKPGEYEKIQEHFSRTTCRKLSQYARNVLLNKPVVVRYRSQSADDFLQEMIGLKKELNAIGNNFNQAVKKLHGMTMIPEVRAWLVTAEPMLKSFHEKTNSIQQKLQQIYTQWSSGSAAPKA